MNKIVLGFIILTLSLGLMVFLRFYQPGVDGRQDGAANPQASDLSDAETVKLVQAVSYLENLKVDSAIPILDELLKVHPDSATILQNKAIGLITQIKLSSDKVGDPSLPQEQIDALRATLPELFEESKKTLELARAAEPKNVDLVRLDVTREELRISQLPPVMENTLKQALLEQILKYLADFPGDPVLTAKLASIAESLDRLSPDIRQKVIQPLEAAYEKNPRNGFLLKSLLQFKSNASDLSVTKLVDQAIEVAKPQAWFMNRLNGGKDFNEELRSAAATAQDEPDAFFAVLDRWTNVFVNTSIQKVDAKATAEIEPLSLIRLDQAYQQYDSPKPLVAKPTSELSPASNFEWITRDIALPAGLAEIVTAQWYDWNVDLSPELLIATKSKVSLFALTEPISAEPSSMPLSLELLFEIDVPSEVQFVKIVDLYEVKSELRSEAAPRTTIDGAISDSYHSTIRDLVVGTSKGFHVIGIQSDKETKKPIASLIPSSETNLPTEGVINQVEAFDIEADGDLDLVAVIGGQLHLFENRGARNFLSADEFSTLPPSGRMITAIANCDYDRDIDSDILISFADGVGCMENIQHGQFVFQDLDSKWQALANANELLFAELDGNISWDWIARTSDSVRILRTTTVPGSSVGVLESTTYAFQSPSDVMTADVNNDSRLDLIAVDQRGANILWQANVELFGFNKLNQSSAQAISISKTFTGQESPTPIFVTHDADSVSLRSASSASTDDYLKLRLKGIADNNGGGRVNEYAIGSTIELFTTAGYQARTVQEDFTHFGLAPNSKAYSLRVIFPNGLTQTIVEPKTNILIEEKQELKGSCPFLYGWDGNKWQLVTDLLWNAPLGLQVARGETIPDRRWEYLMLPRGLMQPKDGAYELRLTEELWEAAYFDQVELLVVDHPAEDNIATNEKVGPPAIATPGFWKYQEQVDAPKITGNDGRDWTEQLSAPDGRYAIPWQGYICQGLVDEHYIEIEIPHSVELDKSQLMLTGWYHPTDTSLNIGISQDSNRTTPKPPALYWVDEDGTAHEFLGFMGFPGGKPKTMVVDLSSIPTVTARSLRIQTSCELYWDCISFIHGSFNAIENTQKLELVSAELHYRGFSKLMARGRFEPHWYDYQSSTQSPKWYPMAGKFTRYGDCLSIVLDDDDRMVVMGSGDELTLRFDTGDHALPEGYVRDFILHNIGWDKDADLNTITGQTSLPLPFKSMKSYPAPVDQRTEQYHVEELNTDTLTREQSIKHFWLQQY